MKRSRSILNEEDNNEFDSEDDDPTPIKQYRRRDVAKIICYRHYDIEDLVNYKREMVTLFYPFRNEVVDILDRLKFSEIFEREQEQILKKKKSMNVTLRYMF